MKRLLTLVSALFLVASTGSVSLAQPKNPDPPPSPKPQAPSVGITSQAPPQGMGQTGGKAPGPVGAPGERNAPALEYTLALIFIFGVLAILCAPSRKGV